MIHQFKVKLQKELKKKERERENNHFFNERMWERIINL